MLQCQRHLFRAFCVIANYRDDQSQQVIFCENEVMCHSHLSSLLYQFSICKDVGVDSPATSHIL